VRTEDGYLVNRCLNGEPEAFGFLVDRYKESVYSFAYAKLGNFHDAEDVTQEVFIKAYQKLRTLKRWDSFHAWIYSITTNLCKNWLRAKSRRPDREYIEDEGPKTLRTSSMNSYRDELRRESLYEALHLLPEIHRQVLTLHYLGGMNTKEIARFLGTSPNAIIQRLYRARAKLKEEMLAMMNITFEEQRLPAGFTIRAVEMVKRMKIQPVPRTAGLPWGISLATGIIIAVLSIGSHLSLPDLMPYPMSSAHTSEMAVTEVGEMPVEILRISQVPVLSGMQGDDYGGGSQLPDQQNAFLAPRGEGEEWPEKPTAQLGKGSIQQIAYSPDGKLLAAAGRPGIGLYDADSLDEITLLEGHGYGTLCVAFSPDGALMASGGADGSIYLWDVARKKKLIELGKLTFMVYSVAFSPDGELVAAEDQTGAVALYSVQEEEQIALLEGLGISVRTRTITFSPDGKLLASGGKDNTIRLWDTAELKQVGLLKGHTEKVRAVAFSPDGEFLASGAIDATVRVWDVEKRKQVALMTQRTSSPQVVAFSSDGKWLAAANEDGTVLLWEVNLTVPDQSVEPGEKQLVTWGKVKKTALFQNFPNPFNPETWIPYNLSKSKHVTIRIYTSTGQLVRTLDLGQKPSGAYLSKEKAAYWDGKNEAGEMVASNIYFYVMEAGETTDSRKMVVAR